MPTQSLPNPEQSGPRVSIRTRSTNSSTATSTAADEALLYVLDRKLRKREGRVPPARHQAVGMRSGEPARIGGSTRSNGWLIPTLSLCLVAGVLAASAVAITASGRSSHTVSGVLLLGAKPLPSVTVSFVPTNGTSAEQPLALTTSAEGRFQTTEDRPLSSGLYSVIVEPGSQSAMSNTIPAIYRDATTTPLRVVVSEDLSELRLSIRR